MNNKNDKKNNEENKNPKEGSDTELKKTLEECQRQKDEYLAGWQRARADFLNYKKDEIEKISGLVRYAEEEILLKVLPILDNFELAERHLSDDEKNEKCLKGFLQIKTQVEKFLKAEGIESIKTIGEKFDPNFHEAVEEVEATEEKKSGIIVEEVQKGYVSNGKLLRSAKVKVTK